MENPQELKVRVAVVDLLTAGFDNVISDTETYIGENITVGEFIHAACWLIYNKGYMTKNK